MSGPRQGRHAVFRRRRRAAGAAMALARGTRRRPANRQIGPPRWAGLLALRGRVPGGTFDRRPGGRGAPCRRVVSSEKRFGEAMSATDSWDWARSRLGTALARASGRDDDSGGVWDEDEGADETDSAGGDVGEPRLTLVSPTRAELKVVSVTTFDDAQAIADAFRCDKPVVVDLQHCENEVA